MGKFGFAFLIMGRNAGFRSSTVGSLGSRMLSGLRGFSKFWASGSQGLRFQDFQRFRDFGI